MNPSELLPPQIELEKDPDPLLAAMLDLEEAARFLDLEPWIVNRLRHSERTTTVNLPLTCDHGEEFAVSGFRVQHFPAGGPTLGPVHLSPSADLHQLRAAALDVTWQLALLELPLSGAAGAIVCDPVHHSERELKALARAYTHALQRGLGPDTDVLSPGAGCNEQIMAWMLSGIYGEANLISGASDPRQLAGVVGKPEGLWGLPQAYSGTAQGLATLLRYAPGRRVSVQGFGAIGSRIARLLHDHGMQVIALADLSGGLYHSEGLDVPAVAAHVQQRQVLYGYPRAEPVRNADVLAGECDVLVLAAAAQQIALPNIDRVRARMVVEVVPGAITRAAEEALIERGHLIVPHVLASLGASIAAYAEWKQNLQLASAPLDLAREIEWRVAKVFDQVNSVAVREHTSLRRAAVLAAVKRLSENLRLTGRN